MNFKKRLDCTLNGMRRLRVRVDWIWDWNGYRWSNSVFCSILSAFQLLVRTGETGECNLLHIFNHLMQRCFSALFNKNTIIYKVTGKTKNQFSDVLEYEPIAVLCSCHLVHYIYVWCGVVSLFKFLSVYPLKRITRERFLQISIENCVKWRASSD